MDLRRYLQLIFLSGFVCWFHPANAQQLHFNVQTTPEICEKGSAKLQVSGHYDSLYFQWSTGQVNQPVVTGLEAGNYSVRTYSMRKQDTVSHTKDTTLFFTVEKELCPLLIPKYFSPNGDGYNDFFTVGNIENFQNFELFVYNKWGQQVHHQKVTFTPWDGRWLGTPLADGAYYYVLYYDKSNSSEFIKGDVMIIR